MKSILLIKKFLELVEMMFGLVYANLSLPERQAVKMTFFAPCISPIYQTLKYLPDLLGYKFTCNNILENFLECWKVATLGPFQQLCHPSNLDIMKLTEKVIQEKNKLEVTKHCKSNAVSRCWAVKHHLRNNELA